MTDTYPMQVSYVNSRFAWPDTIDEAFMQRLLFTKFLHWSYEDEYRAYVSLDTPVDGMYYMDFSKDLVLKQVLVGSESSVTRDQISQALGDWASNVEAFKVRPAFRSFRMVRNRDETLWA